MTTGYHPLVKRLLDGELSLADLPPELRVEGEDALRLVGAVDRAPVTLPAALETRVMETVRRDMDKGRIDKFGMIGWSQHHPVHMTVQSGPVSGDGAAKEVAGKMAAALRHKDRA